MRIVRDAGAEPSAYLVIDASVAIEWAELGPVPPDPYAVRVLHALPSATVVPSIFHLEVANILVWNERKGRVTNEGAEAFLALTETVGIRRDEYPPEPFLPSVLRLARQHRLTAYDASYLELAIRRRLPLATLDQELLRAAAEAGVPIFDPS